MSATSVRAPLGAALALLLALVSLTGTWAPLAMLLATIAAVLTVAAGWPDLLELDSPRGTRIVMAGTGIASALMGYLAPAGLTSAAAIATMCAFGIFGAFVHQMLRPVRTGLTASLTGTVAGSMLTGLAGCWVRAQLDATQHAAGPSLITAGALGLAAALLALAVPLITPLRVALTLAACVLTTAVVGSALGAQAPTLAALVLLGIAIGVASSAAHTLLGSVLTAHEPVPSLTIAAAPVATAGVIMLLAVRMLQHTV